MNKTLFDRAHSKSLIRVSLAIVSLAGCLLPNALLAASTITYVQSNDSVPQTPRLASRSHSLPRRRPGDLNVVAVANDSTATVSTVTDKSGKHLHAAVVQTVQSGVAQSIKAKNIVAAAAGRNIVTVTFSTAAVFPDIRVLEYKGADPNNPVDVTAASSGSSTTSSGAATITNATDLIFEPTWFRPQPPAQAPASPAAF